MKKQIVFSIAFLLLSIGTLMAQPRPHDLPAQHREMRHDRGQVRHDQKDIRHNHRNGHGQGEARDHRKLRSYKGERRHGHRALRHDRRSNGGSIAR
ncbi:MAG: hypothetical protein IPP77_02155 [Bacteroidetes bacterium]|nr:hypothetical protein [Bacteroidota bacterium]